jgi:hypothetical protein
VVPLIFLAKYPELEQQLSSCNIPPTFVRFLNFQGSYGIKTLNPRSKCTQTSRYQTRGICMMKYTHHHSYIIRIRYRSDSLTQKQIFWLELGATSLPTRNDRMAPRKKAHTRFYHLPSFLPSHREHLPKILVSCSSIRIKRSQGFILVLQQHLHCALTWVLVLQQDLHCIHMYSCPTAASVLHPDGFAPAFTCILVSFGSMSNALRWNSCLYSSISNAFEGT